MKTSQTEKNNTICSSDFLLLFGLNMFGNYKKYELTLMKILVFENTSIIYGVLLILGFNMSLHFAKVFNRNVWKYCNMELIKTSLTEKSNIIYGLYLLYKNICFFTSFTNYLLNWMLLN